MKNHYADGHSHAFVCGLVPDDSYKYGYSDEAEDCPACVRYLTQDGPDVDGGFIAG